VEPLKVLRGGAAGHGATITHTLPDGAAAAPPPGPWRSTRKLQ
jgi:hypothetical protein